MIPDEPIFQSTANEEYAWTEFATDYKNETGFWPGWSTLLQEFATIVPPELLRDSEVKHEDDIYNERIQISCLRGPMLLPLPGDEPVHMPRILNRKVGWNEIVQLGDLRIVPHQTSAEAIDIYHLISCYSTGLSVRDGLMDTILSRGTITDPHMAMVKSILTRKRALIQAKLHATVRESDTRMGSITPSDVRKVSTGGKLSQGTLVHSIVGVSKQPNFIPEGDSGNRVSVKGKVYANAEGIETSVLEACMNEGLRLPPGAINQPYRPNQGHGPFRFLNNTFSINVLVTMVGKMLESAFYTVIHDIGSKYKAFMADLIDILDSAHALRNETHIRDLLSSWTLDDEVRQ